MTEKYLLCTFASNYGDTEMNKPYHISFWKRLWSYTGEIVLERITSEYSVELTVSLDRGRLQLSTNDAIYSFEDKYDNFFKVFQAMDLPEKANVLLLGFGLGSIPYMLENNFRKNYHYTGVEIDESVLYLASKYVLPNLKSDLDLVCTDALNFVQQDTNKYDIIAMDVFVNAKIPHVFQTRDFLENLQSMLTPKGIILFNLLYKSNAEKKETDDYVNQIFSKVFPKATFQIVKGNKVLQSQ